MSDRIRTAPDVPFRQVGIGLRPLWRCMGCDQNRPSEGSRGLGVKRRCAVCVAKKRNQVEGAT